MARSKKGKGKKSRGNHGNAISAAYAALEAEFERRIDQVEGEGAYRSSLARLSAWHSAKWFAPFLRELDSQSIPDPMAREERLVELVKPLLSEPSLAFIDGRGGLAKALEITKVVAAPSPMRDLVCELYSLELQADGFESLDLSFFETLVCLDILKEQAESRGILVFLTELVSKMKSGGYLIIADDISFQDDAVENLVSLDFEIHELKSVAKRDLVVLLAQK